MVGNGLIQKFGISVQDMQALAASNDGYPVSGDGIAVVRAGYTRASLGESIREHIVSFGGDPSAAQYAGLVR